MNNSRFSIRWKTFCIFLIFAIVLLGVLWLFQIVYLNDFYKIIKRRETETVLSQIEELVRNNEDDSDTIEEIAASHNLGIFITDRFGNTLYNADYIPNSHIAGMPRYIFGLFYDTAVANGGKAVVEYKGSEMQKDSQEGFLIQQLIGNQESVEIISGATPESENGEINQGEGRVGYTISGRETTTISEFRQNIGDDRAESVIYVSIVENDHRQTVVMINSVLTPIDATVTTLEAQLKMISIIMVVFAFVLAVVNSKSVSRSIISLNDGAKKLAQGDYSVTFDSGDYMEVAELSDTLNYAAKELGKADSLQKELIANVSHDLRTPLTMIKGYAEVMRDIPGENTPENVQAIIEETERLTDLVNDMLDISKLKAGTITIKPAVYNITESIKHVLERYNKLREVDGYTIDFIYDDEIYVEADEQKMYQVIYNLVNNAINYTGEDKKVMVLQKVTDGILRIEVIDTGNGVKQEDIPYVWDRYYKDKTTHKRALQGTGLGLSIVKNVLELHGAKYGVSSIRGKGATFWFELPIVQVD